MGEEQTSHEVSEAETRLVLLKAGFACLKEE
jgi:hypothetical protein